MDDDHILTGEEFVDACEQDKIDILLKIKAMTYDEAIAKHRARVEAARIAELVRNAPRDLANARKELAHVTELFNKTPPGKVIKEYDKDGKFIRSFLVRDAWMSSIRTWRSVIRQIELRMAGKEPKPTPNDWGALGEVDEL
jgi:hypothetical protein